MRNLRLYALLVLILAACSEDDATNSPVPPNNTAQHDTVSLHSPPSNYSSLTDEWVAKYPGLNLGIRLEPEYVIVYQDYRVADIRQEGNRVWFNATDVPFDPYTATFNGTIEGDTLIGWIKSYNRRDGTWIMRTWKLNKRF